MLFGSVNANRRHYYRAAKELAAADRGWLEQLVTRRVSLAAGAGRHCSGNPADIKVIVEMTRAVMTPGTGSASAEGPQQVAR